LDYIADRDTRVTAAVASLLRRAWAVGVEDGKAERLDEVAAVADARRALSRLVDACGEAVNTAADALDDEHVDRQWIAEQLIAAVRSAVGSDNDTVARLRKVGERYTASYARIIGQDPTEPGRRDLVVAVLLDSAVMCCDTDAELAAAVRAIHAAEVRAIHAADQAEEETRKQRTAETLRSAEALHPAAVVVQDDPVGVVDQDHEHDRWWCRICDEQPTDEDDGICTLCRTDIAEGRKTDPNATGGAS
jgi:ABC-type transporter Mla subunit MlaD